MKKTTTKKPKETPITHAEHFRLRLPSEKPRKGDVDVSGRVIGWTEEGVLVMCAAAIHAMPADVEVWIPGAMPASELWPKPETLEEKMRREFEEWTKGTWLPENKSSHGEYAHDATQAAWDAWQAAREVTP